MSLAEDAFAKLSNADAQAGLRAALKQGADTAVTHLSQTNGYWGDPQIRIPLPKSLASAQKLLKPLAQSGLLDDLHLRMNRAAESAAPVARGLFVNAIQTLTINDAVGIIRGGNTAGTLYLQKKTTPAMTAAFTPPMENAMQASGAVDYFDRAIKRNNLKSYFQTDAKTYLGQYATGLALQGLFIFIGREETAIRRDPAKRTTQILKSVFG
ncbi:DUF4197 domain-containing protein [Asticcacaulis taihuensis]|uniref:DUF4197 domain-containing protein n=1 Tax=Asticcacaulis taihuensis TaxID=260084 RepID=UPI0026F058F4|nr:DUF4197 domain-containing protein [Asticcacaulis taihuensis]